MAYQGFPASAPGWQPSPPKRRGRGLLITMVSLGVTMVLGAMLLVVLLNRDDGDGQNSAAGPVPSSAASAEGGEELAPDGGAATVPGWRAYMTGSGGLFDVPPSWKVTMEPGEKGGMFPTAQYKQGVCGDPNQARGIAVPSGVAVPDPHEAVNQMVQRAAAMAISKGTPQISQGPVEEIDQRRYYTKATVSVPQAGSGSCVASTVVMHVVAAESTTGFTMLVVVGDQGVPDAPADEELTQIAKSFRYDAR